MINSFIAAFVALFFWGKATKDVEEKTQLASWVRTIIYGVMAFVVIVFYVKTYQVATVIHSAHISSIRSSVDSANNIADSIAIIKIVNRFSSGISENKEKNMLNTEEERELLKIAEKGGYFIAQNLYNGNQYKKITNPKVKKEYYQNHKPYSVIRYGGYPVDSLSHAYQVIYTTDDFPSLIPLFPRYHFEKSQPIDNFGPYSLTIFSDYDSYDRGAWRGKSTQDIRGNGYVIYDEEKNRQHESHIHATVVTDTITTKDVYHCEYMSANNFISNLNFFTAADISQYSFMLDIQSDCYVKELVMLYDLPIEINSFDSCMTVSTTSIEFKGKYLNDNIVNNGSRIFHVKLPTLANLQLIRSLILTTLLTALVSLFFMNLFYALRRLAISFRENNITHINAERVKSFKIKMYIILTILLSLIVYVSCRIFADKPFHVDIDLFDSLLYYSWWILLGCIIIFSIIIYLLFRKAYFVKKKRE